MNGSHAKNGKHGLGQIRPRAEKRQGEETLYLDQEAFCSPRDAPNVLAKWPGLRDQRLGSNTYTGILTWGYTVGRTGRGGHSGVLAWSLPSCPKPATLTQGFFFLVGFVSLNFHFLQCQTLQKIHASPKAGL